MVKESADPGRPDVLAFVYANDESLDSSSLDTDHTPYLVSVREIEQLTGLDFFTSLSPSNQDAVETRTATKLWSGPDEDLPKSGAFAMRAPPGATAEMVARIDRLYGAEVDEEQERVLAANVERNVVRPCYRRCFRPIRRLVRVRFR